MANITGRLTGGYGRNGDPYDNGDPDNNNGANNNRTRAVVQSRLANMSPAMKSGLPSNSNRVEQGIRGIFQGKSPKVMQFQAKLNGYDATRGVKARDLALEAIISELEQDCRSDSNNRMTPSERSEAIQLVRKKLPHSLDTAEGRQAAQGTKVALARHLDALESINSAQAIKDIDGPQQLNEFNKALRLATQAGPSHFGAVYPALFRAVELLKSPQDQGSALQALAPALPSLNGQVQTDAVQAYLDIVKAMSALEPRNSATRALVPIAPHLAPPAAALLRAAYANYTSVQAPQLQATVVAPGCDAILQTLTEQLPHATDQEARLALAMVIKRTMHTMNPAQQQRTLELVNKNIGRFPLIEQAEMIDDIAGSLKRAPNCDSGTIKAFAGLMPSLKDGIVSMGEDGKLKQSAKFRHYLQIASIKPLSMNLLLDLSEKFDEEERRFARMGYKRYLASLSSDEFEAHIQQFSEPRKVNARALYQEVKNQLASRG